MNKGQLDDLVETMLERGSRTGTPLRPRTVVLTLTVLQQAIDDAVRQGLVTRNVASLVSRPRQSRREMSTWTSAQVGEFLEAIAADRLRAIWMLALLGLRRGEILGLRWADVSLADPAQLAVRRARVLVDGHTVVVTEPKTTRGRRVLPIHAELATALAALQSAQRDERRLLGQTLGPDDHVAADEIGRPLTPDRLTRSFKRHVAQAGLPPIRLHDLRHTTLTLMTLRGVPLPVVAAWAGHADAAFTLRVYAHSQDEALRSASEELASAIRTGSVSLP